jgi:hypothetical protein
MDNSSFARCIAKRRVRPNKLSVLNISTLETFEVPEEEVVAFHPIDKYKNIDVGDNLLALYEGCNAFPKGFYPCVVKSIFRAMPTKPRVGEYLYKGEEILYSVVFSSCASTLFVSTVEMNYRDTNFHIGTGHFERGWRLQLTNDKFTLVNKSFHVTQPLLDPYSANRYITYHTELHASKHDKKSGIQKHRYRGSKLARCSAGKGPRSHVEHVSS